MGKKIYNKPEVNEIRSSALAEEDCSGDPFDCGELNFCCPPGENQYQGDEDPPSNAYLCCC